MKNVLNEIREREERSATLPLVAVCTLIAICVPWAIPLLLKTIVTTAVLYAIFKVLKALLG